MAAFAAKDPANKEAFMTHWAKLMADPVISIRTILYGDRVAGHVASFLRGEEREVCYWRGKEFWGKGIATRALELFLGQMTERPLHARAARDNAASIRVLEKCGFLHAREEKGFSHIRSAEVEEVIMTLDEKDNGQT
jgi:RimJ/RimL family protein N-acetyltransferase